MANTKLSAKTELTSIASGDFLHVVDVSDTTDGASGTSKKITKANLITGLATTDISGVTSSAAELNVLDGIPATLTATELGYSDGVTSAIQTQLDAKAPLASPAFTGTVTIPTPFTLGAVSVTPTGTELNFVDGVTSAIQTQLNAKEPTLASASTTVSGKVELAITSEIDTGTDSTRAMPVDQFVSSTRNLRYIDWRVLASGVNQTVSTTFGGDFEFPFTGTIVSIGAYVDTAGTTNTATIDVHLNGTTIMTTNKISIETTEKSSRTATTQPALTTTAITAGDILTTDIDAIQTTPAKGLVIRLGVRLT